MDSQLDACAGIFAAFNGVSLAVSVGLIYVVFSYHMRSSSELRKIRLALPLWFAINFVQALTHRRGAPLWVEFVTLFTTHFIFFIFFYVIENMISVGHSLELQTTPLWMDRYFTGVRVAVAVAGLGSIITFFAYPRSWTDLYRNIFHYSLHFPLGVPALYGSYTAWAKIKSHIVLNISGATNKEKLEQAARRLRRNMVILWVLFWGGSVVRVAEIANGSLVLANYDLSAPYEEIGCDWGVAVRWILSGIVLLIYCVPPYAAVIMARREHTDLYSKSDNSHWISRALWGPSVSAPPLPAAATSAASAGTARRRRSSTTASSAFAPPPTSQPLFSSASSKSAAAAAAYPRSSISAIFEAPAGGGGGGGNDREDPASSNGSDSS